MIALGILLLWLACWAADARWFYRKYRPFTEPVNCPGRCYRDHDKSCYARRKGSMIDRNEAIVFGALFGLLGPLAVLIPVITWIITSGDRQAIEETRASIARLEKENRQLRSRQD